IWLDDHVCFKVSFRKLNCVGPTRTEGETQICCRVGVQIVERVSVAVALDPYLSLRALAQYSGLSIRTLREHVASLTHPLPTYRVGTKILVRRSEFDSWMARYRVLGKPSLIAALQAAAPRSLRRGPGSPKFPRTSGVADAAQKGEGT